jgi:hypothetical protein
VGKHVGQHDQSRATRTATRPDHSRPAATIPARGPSPTPAAAIPVRGPSPTPAEALQLQRTAGNRAASRALARWTKHPDPEKKGVIVPDVVAEQFERFNPPKNA